MATRLRRYTRETEKNKITALFSKEPSKVYSQLLYNNTVTTEPAETKLYWKNIWEEKKTHNTSAKWIQDLRADHSNLKQQSSTTKE